MRGAGRDLPGLDRRRWGAGTGPIPGGSRPAPRPEAAPTRAHRHTPPTFVPGGRFQVPPSEVSAAPTNQRALRAAARRLKGPWRGAALGQARRLRAGPGGR